MTPLAIVQGLAPNIIAVAAGDGYSLALDSNGDVWSWGRSNPADRSGSGSPTPVRLARIRRREHAKFGDRIKPGGDMAQNHSEFLNWAASYDDPYFRGRSLQRHRDWLAGRAEPVLELSGTRPIEDSIAAVLARLG